MASEPRRGSCAAVELFRDGVRNVTSTLAQEEGRQPQTVRDWIGAARAEERGFLAPTKQGRTDFRPGPNLYRKGDPKR
jgi:hypothetical protein